MEGTTSSQSQSQSQSQSRLGWLAGKLLNPLGNGANDDAAAAQAQARARAEDQALIHRLAGRVAEAEGKVDLYQQECLEQHRLVEDLLKCLSDEHGIQVDGRVVPSDVEGVRHKYAGLALVVDAAAEQERQALRALREACEGIAVVERREIDLTRPRYCECDEDEDDDAGEDGSDHSDSEGSGEGDEDEDEDELETEANRYHYKTVFEVRMSRRDARLEQQELENTAQAHELEDWMKLYSDLSEDHDQLQEDFKALRQEKCHLEEENESLQIANCNLVEVQVQQYMQPIDADEGQKATEEKELRQTIEDLQTRLDMAQAERQRDLEDYNRTYARDTGRIAWLKDENRTLSNALATSEQRQQLAALAKQDAEARTNAAVQQLCIIQRRQDTIVSDLQDRLGRAQGEKNEVTAQLYREHQKAQESEARLREHVAALQKQIRAEADDLEETQRELCQLKQKKTELEDRAEQDRQHRVVCKNEVESLFGQIRQKNGLLEQREAQLEELQAQLVEAQEAAEEQRKGELAALEQVGQAHNQLSQQKAQHQEALRQAGQRHADINHRLYCERKAEVDALRQSFRQAAVQVNRQAWIIEDMMEKSDETQRRTDHDVALLTWAVEELRDEKEAQEARVRVLEGQVDYLRWRRTGNYAAAAESAEQQEQGQEQQQDGYEQVCWEHIEDAADGDSSSDVRTEEEDEDVMEDSDCDADSNDTSLPQLMRCFNMAPRLVSVDQTRSAWLGHIMASPSKEEGEDEERFPLRPYVQPGRPDPFWCFAVSPPTPAGLQQAVEEEKAEENSILHSANWHRWSCQYCADNSAGESVPHPYVRRTLTPTWDPPRHWRFAASPTVEQVAARLPSAPAARNEENADAEDEDEEMPALVSAASFYQTRQDEDEEEELDFISLPELSEDEEGSDSDYDDESLSVPTRPVSPTQFI